MCVWPRAVCLFVTVMSDIAAHPTDYSSSVVDRPILAEQAMVLTFSDGTDGLSKPAIHLIRPFVSINRSLWCNRSHMLNLWAWRLEMMPANRCLKRIRH